MATKTCRDATKRIMRGEDSDENCTANISLDTPIGSEGLYAFNACEDLKASGLKVKSVTGDGDCDIDKGVKKSFPNAYGLRDSIHFSKSQKTGIQKDSFSDIMFPGNQNVKSRRKSLWAQEIRERCSAEKKARKSSKTRTQKIKEMEKLLEKVPDAIISCYKGGSHSMCDKYSLVCSKKKRWDKSGLPSVMQRKMNMTRLDQKKNKAPHFEKAWFCGCRKNIPKYQHK